MVNCNVVFGLVRLSLNWERNGDGRALAQFACDLDIAPVQENDLADDCQSEAGAAGLAGAGGIGAIEAVEDSGQGIGGDSGAVVGDFDQNASPFLASG